MRRHRIRACLLAVCLLVSGTGSGTVSGAACSSVPLATIPLGAWRGIPTLTITLNGTATRVALDTGSPFTVLRFQLADTLRLAPTGRVPASLATIAGGEEAEASPIAQIGIGGVEAGPRDLLLALLPVFDNGPDPPQGLLGLDLLGGYDLDIDLARHRLILFAPTTSCLPSDWPSPSETLPVTRSPGGHVTVQARLAGREVAAMLDTAAEASSLRADDAGGLGIDEAALGADPPGVVTGPDHHRLAGRLHRLGPVALGGAVLPDVVAYVGLLQTETALVLGAPALEGRRLFLGLASGRAAVGK